MPIPVIPDIPVGSQSANAATDTTGTLQSAAALTGNGSTMSVAGMATVVFMINTTGFSGTVDFEASIDGTNFVDIYATNAGTTTVGSDTGSLTTDTSISLWVAQIAGFTSIQAPITRSAGSVTVTAAASPAIQVGSANPSISAVTLSAGTALAGGVNLVDSAGTNQAGVDASHNVLVKVNAALPAGTALLGGAYLVDSAGTNKAAVDALHSLQVTDGGTSAITVTASSAAAIKAAAGRLCKVLVNTTVTSAVTVYDNTNAASGVILATIPTTAAVGSLLSYQFPAAVGIYVAGGAGSPSLTVSYI